MTTHIETFPSVWGRGFPVANYGLRDTGADIALKVESGGKQRGMRGKERHNQKEWTGVVTVAQESQSLMNSPVRRVEILFKDGAPAPHAGMGETQDAQVLTLDIPVVKPDVTVPVIELFLK